MTNAARLAAVVLIIAALAACTPVRSRIAPPYRVDGRSLSAQEMQQYAEDRCRVAASTATQLPPHPFTTDGCSAYRDAGWQSCCIRHDVEYWCGATPRRHADLEFRQCVRDASSAANANLMYAAVRVGGGRFVPFPWRYGYGWKWPHRKSPGIPAVATESSDKVPR